MAEIKDSSYSEMVEFVGAALGGERVLGERFTLYVPNKGRAEKEGERQVAIPDWDRWCRRALDILGNINGGATASSVSGFYTDDGRNGEIVLEDTVLVYSFVRNRTHFRSRIKDIRKFVHEFGRETRQGSVFFEFDGIAFEIKDPFDAAS